MVGERQVGQVVVPDRVVQAEGLVAVAPGVARALVLLDDDGRHAQPPQPRAERDAALPAADDEHVGLVVVAQRAASCSSCAPARSCGPGDAVLGALDAVPPFFSSKPLSSVIVVSSVQHLPFQAQMAAAARRGGLEGEPGLGHAVGLGGLLGEGPVARLHVGQRRVQHPRMSALPSRVLMFQVKVTRSRQ